MYLMASVQIMSPAEIKETRLALGWTQDRMATALGVGKSTVSHWEKGIRHPHGSAEILLNHYRDMALRDSRKKLAQTD
jgi:DNA-binding transcriptional regulator YiaG